MTQPLEQVQMDPSHRECGISVGTHLSKQLNDSSEPAAGAVAGGQRRRRVVRSAVQTRLARAQLLGQATGAAAAAGGAHGCRR